MLSALIIRTSYKQSFIYGNYIDEVPRTPSRSAAHIQHQLGTCRKLVLGRLKMLSTQITF